MNLAKNIVLESIGDISILIIDDDSTSVASLTSMLEQFSYKVMSVNVASDAVSMIKKQKEIGLIIANIEISDVDSHSFLTTLLNKEIPLILITPETNTKEASDLLTKNACFCLKKPISENDIKIMCQHVVPKKSQELEKINIAEQQENVVEGSILNQIESFRETIKRQRTSQSSLLGRRLFIKRFTTSETYQKRKSIANDEGKTKPVYLAEAENKIEERSKMDNNVGRRCNLWTPERHMKFLTAISILGEKYSRPKSILRIINDSKLNHRQVSSHLQKYKSQVERMNDILSRNEWRSTNKTFDYPSDYEYPFSASNLMTNLIESDKEWFSLKKNEASSSSIAEYSNKNSKMPNFHLGGKLDLSKHSFFGNVLNKSPIEVNYVPPATTNNPPSNISSTNDVNYSGLSSDNPPVQFDLPSIAGASNTDAFQMEFPGICIPQSQPNPFQSLGSYVLETDRNQLELGPMEFSYEIPPPTNMSTILETNTDHMNWLLSQESLFPLEDMTSFEISKTQSLETNLGDMGLIPCMEDNDVPIEDLISFDIDVNETEIDFWLENYGSSEENIPLLTSELGHDFAFCTPMNSTPHTTMENHDQSLAMNLESTSQQHNMMESCSYQNIEAPNPREPVEGGDHFDDDPECMDWIDEILNKEA